MTRHFFSGLFRLSFLDDAGEESFKRAILGVLAATMTLGLALVRLLAGGAAAMAWQVQADLYPWMIAADQLFMICLPMFVVGLVMSLAASSIFPSEVDFWTLMALPLSRPSIFAAKFLAVFIFAAIFVIGVNVGLTLPLALVFGNRHTGGQFSASLLAQLTCSVLASAFTVACVVAVQGTVIAIAPRHRYRAVAIATQTVLICGLVLSIPLIAHVPALGPTLRERPAWLLWLPPAWFLGVEQWILGRGDPYVARLAFAAGAGSVVVLIAVAIGGVAAYHRFDCAVLKGPSPPAFSSWTLRRVGIWPRHPAHDGIRLLTSATLRRSGLHQLVWFGMCAVGVALAANTLIDVIGLRERWVLRAALGTPFTLMAASVVGLRTALLVPTALRAGWIFRLTETAAHRPHQLDAVMHALLLRGVALPSAIAFPVHAAALGPTMAAALLPLVVMMGCIFVEIVSLEWRRIPFTSTFLFAKRSPAYTFGLAILIFGWLVFIGASMLNVARTSVAAWLSVGFLLSVVFAAVRWYRMRTWGQFPLEFEDYLPDGINTLKLK